MADSLLCTYIGINDLKGLFQPKGFHDLTSSTGISISLKHLTHFGLEIEMDTGNIIQQEDSHFLPFFPFAGGEN